jgi:hypothetical protein
MATRPSPTRADRASATALLLACLAFGWGSVRADTGARPQDPFLASLAGRWDFVGSVGKRAVRYRVSGKWALAGGWLRLQLRDVAKPPGYVADVFFGYDAKADDYVVHWIDQFGAPGARVVATGQLTDRTLVFTFPYAEGAFRDTLTLAPEAATGSLLIEAQKPDGSWSTFASYRLARRR